MKKRSMLIPVLLMICAMAGCRGKGNTAPAGTEAETAAEAVTAAEETEAETTETSAAETGASETAASETEASSGTGESASGADGAETTGAAAAAETSAAEESGTSAAADSGKNTQADRVLSHAEFVEAEMDTEVTVETYVQAKQALADGKATLYAQSEDGAYLIYEMPCSDELYAKLAEGQKILVRGRKTVWSGEVRIEEASFRILDGTYAAAATDVTDLLDTSDLEDHQNEKVSFRGMTVEAAAGNSETAYSYGWDGSGEEGDDLYFNVSQGDKTYSFMVNAALSGADSEVYQAAKSLKVGDTVDLEGFLYWYEGPNPHITSIAVRP